MHALEALRILVVERRLERRRITTVSPMTGMMETIISTLGVKPLPARAPGRALHLAQQAEFSERTG